MKRFNLIILLLLIQVLPSCQNDTPILIINNLEFTSGVATLRIVGDSIQNHYIVNANFMNNWDFSNRQRISIKCSSGTDTIITVNLIKPNYYRLELVRSDKRKNYWVDLFLKQDENLEIHIKEKDEPDIEFAGSLATINNYLLEKENTTKADKQAYWMSLVSYVINSDGTQRQMPIAEWPKYDSGLTRALNSEINFLKGYSFENNLPLWFKRIEKNQIIYKYANEKLGYIFRKLELPPDGISFLDSLAIDNPQAEFSDSYYSFLRSYFYFQISSEWEDRIPGYFSLNHEEKINAQKNYVIGTNEIDQLKIDSLLKEHFTSGLKLARKSLSENALKNLAFFTAMSNLYLAPSSSHPGINAFQFYSENFSDQMFDSLLTRMVSKKFNLAEGDEIKSHDFLDEKSEVINLSQLRGRVLLLTFWFPGCRPCIDAIPGEIELAKEFANQDFALVTIGTRANREMCFNFAEKFNKPGLVLFAEYSESLVEKYDLVAYPKYILVDKKGRIVSLNPPKPGQRELSRMIIDEL